MKRIFTHIFLLGCSLSMLIAGGDPQPLGARTLSLGGAFTAVHSSVWAMGYNPAGIAWAKGFQGGVHAEQRFMLSELSSVGVAALVPFQEKHFAGLEVSSFGFSGYRENKVGLNYATVLYDNFSLGVKANYFNTNIPDLGSASAVFVDIGMNVKVSKTFHLGASAYNVNQAKVKTLASGAQKLPTLITIGCAYQPSDKVLVVADLQKDILRPLSFRGGVEYKIAPIISARAGLSTQPVVYNVGAGVNWKSFQLDLNGGLHERLGFTPAFSLTYVIPDKVEE